MMGLERAALWLGALTGWRRCLFALVLGTLGAAAMPPFNLVPALVPSLTGLVWLIDGRRTWRGALADGWLWGMGFFVPSVYWVSLALFVDIAQFWWLLPFALLGLPAAIGLYIGIPCSLAYRLAPPGLGRVLLLAATWTLFEWIRAHAPFGGFPWLLLGYAWSGDASWLLAMAQGAALVGVYGLSYLTVMTAAMPSLLRRPGPRAWIVPLLPMLLLAGLMLWGNLRLGGGDDIVPGVVIRLNQTNQKMLAVWSEAARFANLRENAALAQAAGGETVTAEIWPESSISFWINRRPDLSQAIGAILPPDGLVLAGSEELAGDGPTASAWNSLVAIDPSGAIIASYHKFHLVPFGEYVPLHDLLQFNQIISDRFDFATGPGPQTITLPHLPPVAPIICYESIFSGEVVDQQHRPAWILNVTNDAWYGDSIGPVQHFAMARLRAIEEGMPLLRAANGGISGAFDAHGRSIGRLTFGTSGFLDVKLPIALGESTPYEHISGNIGFIFLVASIFTSIFSLLSTKK